MNPVSQTAAQATKLIFVCIIATAVFIVAAWIANKATHKFSPPPESGSAGSTPVSPARYTGAIRIEESDNVFDGLVFKDCTFSEPNAITGRYRVTAYCANSCCCGEWADGLTASGKPAVGLIVAAPPGMPFGTVLEIPGYGRCRVQDRGAAITGNRLDVLFATHQEALNWGVQELMIKEIR